MIKIEGLILAGSGDLKDELLGRLDPRLAQKVVQTLTVSYGGENGLNQVSFLEKKIF